MIKEFCATIYFIHSFNLQGRAKFCRGCQWLQSSHDAQLLQFTGSAVRVQVRFVSSWQYKRGSVLLLLCIVTADTKPGQFFISLSLALPLLHCQTITGLLLTAAALFRTPVISTTPTPIEWVPKACEGSIVITTIYFTQLTRNKRLSAQCAGTWCCGMLMGLDAPAHASPAILFVTLRCFPR